MPTTTCSSTPTVRRVPLKRGLDLQGGMHLALEVEGLVVGPGITLGDLKGTIEAFLRLPGAARFEPMPGRPMRGFVTPPRTIATNHAGDTPGKAMVNCPVATAAPPELVAMTRRSPSGPT